MDVCLIAGIFVSGVFLVRNVSENEKIWSESARNDADEEVIFEGAPPLTQGGHALRDMESFGSTYKISVALSYPSVTSLSTADAKNILLQLPKASSYVEFKMILFFLQNCFCEKWSSATVDILWTLIVDEIQYSGSLRRGCDAPSKCKGSSEILPPYDMVQQTTFAHVHIWAQGLPSDLTCLPETVHCAILESGCSLLQNTSL